MKTIELHLSDELADRVQQFGNPETFIISLIQSKVKELNTPLTLADEYKLAAKENKTLIKDFSHIDTEGWDDEY